MNKIFTIAFIIIFTYIGCGSSSGFNNLDNKIKLLYSGGAGSIGYNIGNPDPTEDFRYAIVSDTDQYTDFINDINNSAQDMNQSASSEALSKLYVENNFDKFNVLFFSKLYYMGCSDCREVLSLKNDLTVEIKRKIITGGGNAAHNVEAYLYRVSKDIKTIVLHGVNLDNNSTALNTISK